MSLHAVRFGHGRRLVLVHGSAADHATWTIQLASAVLRERFELLAYDRRREGSVDDHADDLAAMIGDGPAIAVGSSFGAVVVLACARRHADRLRGVVLCEPPLPPADDAPPVPAGFLDRLDATAAAAGGEAAAELFLRTVLGDALFDRMPRAFRDRATALWPEIRADCHALGAFRVGYDTLGEVAVPALLVGGDRSPSYFRATLEALASALPRARLVTLAGAGHMMHAEAPRGFQQAVLAFADEVWP
jgi:pimeloyl-ACP methyl ester carboxylesterase